MSKSMALGENDNIHGNLLFFSFQFPICKTSSNLAISPSTSYDFSMVKDEGNVDIVNGDVHLRGLHLQGCPSLGIAE
jgi:hypothetical protein